VDVKNILWPNDLTPMAPAVLPVVQSLIEAYDAQLHLLHVATDISSYGEFWGKPDSEYVDKMHAFMLERSRSKLEALCQEELATCSTYKIHLRLGDPGEEILKATRELEIDLVVMGVRSIEMETGVGSVMQKVLRGTKVPVFAVTP